MRIWSQCLVVLSLKLIENHRTDGIWFLPWHSENVYQFVKNMINIMKTFHQEKFLIQQRCSLAAQRLLVSGDSSSNPLGRFPSSFFSCKLMFAIYFWINSWLCILIISWINSPCLDMKLIEQKNLGGGEIQTGDHPLPKLMCYQLSYQLVFVFVCLLKNPIKRGLQIV